MKRFLTLFFSLVLLLCVTPAAHADVLWEPDNHFYAEHFQECSYVNRSYYANGSKGYVTVLNAPGGSLVNGQFKNGFILNVYWQYEDWGCVTVWGDEEHIDGWIPMSDLALIYDHISFAEEHAGELRSYNGEFAGYSGDSSGIVFREYPGASAPKLVWDYNDITPQLTGTADEDSYISQIYEDENGLTWGYIGYLYGSRNLWFCLDDPKGELLPTPSDPSSTQSTTAPTADGVELIPPQEPRLPSSSFIPYILVACVVVVTAAILIWLHFRKKSDNASGQ